MKNPDLQRFTDDLIQSMRQQLTEIAEEKISLLIRTSRSCEIARATLQKIKVFVHSYNFHDQKEEIKFFKEIKPVVESQYLFLESQVKILLTQPLSREERSVFYDSELTRIQIYRTENLDFYRYCTSNSSYLDGQYFVRNPELTDPSHDQAFNTFYGQRLAQLLANELLKDYLLATVQQTDVDPTSLLWTGSKTALIELAYALHAASAFNHGNADVKQIALAFENIFQVNLGNYYRAFQEIRQRKINRTAFLDELKNKLTQRMDNLD